MPLAEVPLHVAGAPTLEHDPGADRAALEELAALFAGRLSPRVGVPDVGEEVEPCGLVADIAGCAHLFGGDRAMVRTATELARGEGLGVRAGLANGVGAAWASARYGGLRDGNVAESGELDILPVAALRLSVRLLVTLEGLGVGTVGDARRLPRASLPSRFGPVLSRRLDQFDGAVSEPVEPVRPPAPVTAAWEGEFPPVGRSGLARVCEALISDVLDRLPAGRGVREAEFLFDADDGSGGATVALAAARSTRDASRLRALLDLKLERVRLSPPRRITLTATAHERLRVSRTTLFGGGDDRERELDDLLETLSGRLGADRVCRAESTGDPIPERSFRFRPAIGGGLSDLPGPAGWLAGSRPATLIHPPEPVRVLSLVPDGPPFRLVRRGRSAVDLASAWGPERVRSGWWAGPRVERDYWRTETGAGERLWLYRDLRAGRWFLHGLFD